MKKKQYKRRTDYSKVGAKKKPVEELKKQVVFSVKQKYLDAVGGKEVAARIAREAVLSFAQKTTL